MVHQESERLFKKYALRQTPIRKEILQLFLARNYALSHGDLEDALPAGTDRVTIYRTLKSFEQAGLIHKVPNNAGIEKYAICKQNCVHHQHYDNHVHFSCENCAKTYCLDHIHIPQLSLPEGFTAHEFRFLVSGICLECSKA